MATAETSEKQEMDRDQKQIKSQVSVSPDTESTSMAGGKGKFGAVPKDRERKIGHRRVDESGTVTYKKKPTSELMAAIQLGIGQSVGGLSSKPERDLLMQDFAVVQSVVFPSEGSNMTPAHHYSDFRFKTYAPMAFRFFRELFNIRPDDFMLSLCDEQLTELSNPGAGGSIFYISSDDEFIIKTTQHKEANFLQKLLPGYYMNTEHIAVQQIRNLNQNPRTTLPKFYGLYCYQCGGKNIRFCVMNNILPSTVKMHEKYDLKGSTYKRKASKTERAKSSPTLKDLDFIDLHPEGLLLEKDTYDALIKTIQRDCRVLESFKIMDYSLLVGIHNLDKAKTEKTSTSSAMNMTTLNDGEGLSSSQRTATTLEEGKPKVTLARGKSIRTKVTQYSTPMESIQADVHSMLDEFDDEDIPPGGIPAKNAKGERLLLYLGVIDILQYYRFRKKFEHTVKSMITDGDTVSVTRPSFYAERFLKFFTSTVFRKAPSPLKHSPSKRKGTRTISMTEDSSHPLQGTTGARPDLLMGSSTPPPTFAEATTSMRARDRIHSSPGTSQNAVDSEVNRSDRAHFQTIQQQEGGIKMRYSPLSVSESTPTYTEFTEGTPSYTASSPSCSSEVLDSHIPNLPLEKDAINTFQDTTDSPSRLMVASSSTEASYYSTVSHIDPGDGRETSSVIVTRSEERFSNTQNSSQVVEGKNKSDQNSTDVSNKSDINNPQYKDSYKANVTTVKLESTIGSKSVGEGYSETSWRKKDVSIVGGDSDQTNEKTPFNEVEESHQWWENREQEPPRHRGRGGLVPCFPISDKRITDSLITFIESGKGGLEAL